MSKKDHPKTDSPKQEEISFKPRIINPLKISNVVIFSADELVRKAARVVREKRPWIQVQTLADPGSLSEYKSGQSSVFIMDDTAMTLAEAEKIRENNKEAVLILLSFNDFIHRSPPSVVCQKYPFTSKADLIFAVDKDEYLPEKIILSALRCGEDLLNIHKYSKERRFIFLIVDDEPRWFSQFLPVLYNIVGQRGDVMVTRTYEESMDFLFGVKKESQIDEERYFFQGHGDDVVCIITDIFFPRGKDLQSDAGRDLFRLINQYYPRIPVIIASKAKEAFDFQDKAFILPKGDPGSVQTLKDYIHDYTGLGDFLIQDKQGEELYRVKNIYQMKDLLIEAQKESPKAQRLRKLLEIYADKDAFSTWLYMHGFRELGDKLRPRHFRGEGLIVDLKEHIEQEISRIEKTPLILDGKKVFDLHDLVDLLRSGDSQKIQKLAHNDWFSTFLDCKSYSELAEEIRPIHGKGEKLRKALLRKVEKWRKVYQQRAEKSQRD
ncbi:hypothetical protein KGY73_08350 [bacterium]|nr:hypothetical protein [bacterium]